LREFLRRCPACGRRFTVRARGKKLINAEHDAERLVHNAVVTRNQPGGGVIADGAVTEVVPIEREESKITFECQSCHYRWTETVTEVEKAK